MVAVESAVPGLFLIEEVGEHRPFQLFVVESFHSMDDLRSVQRLFALEFHLSYRAVTTQGPFLR